MYSSIGEVGGQFGTKYYDQGPTRRRTYIGAAAFEVSSDTRLVLGVRKNRLPGDCRKSFIAPTKQCVHLLVKVREIARFSRQKRPSKGREQEQEIEGNTEGFF